LIKHHIQTFTLRKDFNFKCSPLELSVHQRILVKNCIMISRIILCKTFSTFIIMKMVSKAPNQHIRIIFTEKKKDH